MKISVNAIAGVMIIACVLFFVTKYATPVIDAVVVTERYPGAVDSFMTKYSALQSEIYREASEKVLSGEIKSDVEFDKFLQSRLSVAPEQASKDIGELFEKDYPRKEGEGVSKEKFSRGLRAMADRFGEWSKGI